MYSTNEYPTNLVDTWHVVNVNIVIDVWNLDRVIRLREENNWQTASRIIA